MAKREAIKEDKEYRDLVEWLNQADDILKIVDRPVHDRQSEYEVRLIISITSTFY